MHFVYLSIDLYNFFLYINSQKQLTLYTKCDIIDIVRNKSRAKSGGTVMDFITTWNYQIKDRKVLPFLESLIGTEVRFRDKTIDRRKTYGYHSPAHTISRMLSRAACSGEIYP